MSEYVKWFRELADSQEEWAKELKIGQLFVAGFPIPSGFVILHFSGEEIPEEVTTEITYAYNQLNASYNINHLNDAAKGLVKFGRSEHAVLVRVNKGKTIPNITGEEALLNTVKECWAESDEIIIVQKMMSPSKSGIIQPSGNDFVIKASYGFVGPIARGQVDADEYTIPADGEIQKKLGSKDSALIIDPLTHELKKADVDISKRNEFALHDRELEVIAKLAKKLNQQLGQPQKIQWVIEGHKVYLLDFEPVESFTPSTDTGLLSVTPVTDMLTEKEEIEEVETPEPAFPLPSEPETTPDTFIPSVQEESPSESLFDESPISPQPEPAPSEPSFSLAEEPASYMERSEPPLAPESEDKTTGTGIGTIVDMPLYSDRAAKTNPDSVLLRLESLILNAGISPLNRGEYSNNITRGVQSTLETFSNKEVYICLPDIRSDKLDDGLEKNPMLGWHGARRLGSEHIDSELMAIKQAIEASGHRNVKLLLPFVTHQSEIKKAEDLVFRHGLSNFVKLGVIIETPAAVHIADLLCSRADLVIVDVDHLTEFMLAVDKNNEKVSGHYDSKHPAISKALSLVAKACKENSTKLYVCGEILDIDMVNFLVKNRVDGVFTNSDRMANLRSEIFRAERKLLLDVAADRG